MNSHQHLKATATKLSSAQYTCPLCGEFGISTSIQTDKFVYGDGKTAAELSVDLPVHYCAACDFQFVDSKGEDIKHRAVCQHLGVLPPEAIAQIRKKHGLSRAAFAQVTGLGEASLSRWEKGINIQNPANDRYIRLLEDPLVMHHLQELATIEELKSRQPENNVLQFRSLEVTEKRRKQQADFQLRKAA